MGIGKKVDTAVGAMSRLLHLRSARHNTIPDLEPYLDQEPQVLFPEPPRLPTPRIKRKMLDRVFRTSTLSWQSTHEVLCPRYRRRHERGYKRNLTGWARWLRPDGEMRRDVIIYVHGWLEPGSWAEEASLFRHWSKVLDVDIVHVTLPFHGLRNPRTALFSGEFFWTADLVRTVEGVRQAVHDTRAVMAWLRERGYRRVGISGISLGGSLTMLLACLDPLPDFIAPIIGHLQLIDAVENAPILWRMKRDLERWGVDASQRRDLFERLGIADYEPLLSPTSQLWIEAEEDLYIDPDLVRQQWNAWGKPHLFWIPGGHMTFPLHVPKLSSRLKEFLAELD